MTKGNPIGSNPSDPDEESWERHYEKLYKEEEKRWRFYEAIGKMREEGSSSKVPRTTRLFGNNFLDLAVYLDNWITDPYSMSMDASAALNYILQDLAWQIAIELKIVVGEGAADGFNQLISSLKRLAERLDESCIKQDHDGMQRAEFVWRAEQVNQQLYYFAEHYGHDNSPSPLPDLEWRSMSWLKEKCPNLKEDTLRKATSADRKKKRVRTTVTGGVKQYLFNDICTHYRELIPDDLLVPGISGSPLGSASDSAGSEEDNDHLLAF
ncbi:hypothetical protein [Mucisphaera sp.]|uniref:hypothetical protein n=1 Tax=Mucisphaera sp. TaxID=2913024 RepID=UPI003D128F31